MTRVDEILKQLDALVMRHSGFLEWKEPPHRLLIGLLTSAQSAIERLAPPNSAYRGRCQETLQNEYSSESYKLERLMGIVEALREDYRAGALAPIQDLIRAEVFDNRGRSSDISVTINEWGVLLTFLISFSWLRLLTSARFTTRIWDVSKTGCQGNE